jgi:hypothetical protein
MIKARPNPCEGGCYLGSRCPYLHPSMCPTHSAWVREIINRMELYRLIFQTEPLDYVIVFLN